MVKLKKSLIPALIFFSIVTAFTSGTAAYAHEHDKTLAVENTTYPGITREDKARTGIKADQMDKNDRIIEKPEDMQKMLKLRACEQRKTRIGNRVKMLNNTERFHTKRFEFFITRLEKLIERVSEKGHDTTTLKADLTDLKVMEADLNEMWTAFIEKVKGRGEFDCTDLENPQEATTQELKNELAAIKTKAEEIRNYINETIRPDLKTLYAEIRTDKAGEETDKSSEQ